MIYPIRYYGDPVLRKTATPVQHFDDELEQLASDMLETMYDANGVGLAAPQIGLLKRIFVALQIAPLNEEDEENAEPEPEADLDTLSPEQKRKRWGVVAEHVMINPEIVEREGVQYGQDGCLSVPGLFVEAMRRDERVRVRYQDLQGDTHELEAEGHFAHVIQHELDHLDGVLFFDRLPEEEKRLFAETHRSELADMQREAKALLKQLKNEPIAARVR